MRFDDAADIRQLTPLWKGERFENGRPRVATGVLERIRNITLEQAWGPLWRKDYLFQFEGDFRVTHPDRVLVGRALTAVMVPRRPDLDELLLRQGHEREDRRGFFNQWVIDSLVEDDVIVIDLFDKIFKGTYVGGNLSTAIAERTKRGGAVIWGGIRDLQQIREIEGINVFYRGTDPTGIADVTMVGMNVPCRIGKATCLPGDVVLGTPGGVLFIPSHLAEETLIDAEKSRVRDIFGFIRLREGRYSTAEIDAPWTPAIWSDFTDWLGRSEEAKGYRHLDWSAEVDEARRRQGPSEGVRL